VTGIARAARWTGGALAGLGVRDLAGALVVILIVVAALCWVLANEDRSRRLAEILGAWRAPARALPASRRGRPPGASAAGDGSGPPVLPSDGVAGAG
jgi:hypothetical protein